MRRAVLFLLLMIPGLAPVVGQAQTRQLDLKLPLKEKSVRFAVIGDSGTGDAPQFEIGKLMAQYREQFPFEFVLMLGDNIYGGHKPSDYRRKFEEPYKTLLDAGVKFYGSLGNHDDSNQRFYKPFNMDGKRYYTIKSGNVELFALDSNYMDPEQIDWLNSKIPASGSNWKICFFHHPLYSHGRFHGPDEDLRTRLEPIFVQRGVNVVFSGHEHVYERLKPQKGIQYWVLGNSGQLRFHNLRSSSETAKGIDTVRTFMLVEVAGDQMYFQTISDAGETVDSGVVERQSAKMSSAASANQ